MLTLNDGRTELWQWDTGRKLTVDADCTQVHFSNKVFGRSVDVNVVDGTAAIPDVLLQVDKELLAWAFVGTAENGYTKISKVFKVNKRNKPADYVFTPTDQTSLEELIERLDAIEESQDPDAIKNAVEDYLEQNPVEAPVESVNGKTGEVKLTAEDVGAISQDDLQEATNEALAQAKASGAFDGKDGQPGAAGKDGYTPVKGVDYFDGADGKDYILTEADKQEIAEQAAELVEVPGSDLSGLVKSVNGVSPDENGNVEIAVSGGGGGDSWETISDVTVTEETTLFKFELSKKYSAFKVHVADANYTDGKDNLILAFNGQWNANHLMRRDATAPTYGILFFEFVSDTYGYGFIVSGAGTVQSLSPTSRKTPTNKAGNVLWFGFNNGSKAFTAGRIKVYGKVANE